MLFSFVLMDNGHDIKYYVTEMSSPYIRLQYYSLLTVILSETIRTNDTPTHYS